MDKNRKEEILNEQKNCHPSRYHGEYISRLIKCVEVLSERVDYLESLNRRHQKEKGGRR